MNEWLNVMLQSYCGLGLTLLILSAIVSVEVESDFGKGAATWIAVLGGLLFVIPGLLLIGGLL